MTLTATDDQGEAIVDFIAEYVAQHGYGQDEERGAAIVRFIGAYVKAHGYSPSIREIGQAVGLSSTSGVHHQLLALEKAGSIMRAANRARAIVIPRRRVAA